MVFNTRAFLFFIIAVYLLFWTIPKSWKRVFLLLASYFFYGFMEPVLTLLLLAVTITSYLIAQKIEDAKNHSLKKAYLILGLVTLISPLIYFKYFNFITQNLNIVIKTNIPFYNIILPVGISFFTFQVVGYMMDIYRGELKAARNFITFALFKSFFPQLVAGPIERAHNLLPQLETIHNKTYSSENFHFALKMILWGLFKKVVIADRLAQFVDPIYNQESQFNGLTLLVATIFFAFQIYCDFSGYSDMAIGIAKLFNVNLMKNFNRPYFALSVTDFWRRWHISLSTWFKDYLYLPLGGNRVKLAHWCFNIMIVFVVSGFWHGAKWTFVIWGLIHGLGLIANRFSRLKLPTFIKFTLTFTFVNLAWVFFRAHKLKDATNILHSIITDSFTSNSWDQFVYQAESIGFDSYKIAALVMIILTLIGLEVLQQENFMPKWFNLTNQYLKSSFIYIVLLLTIFFGYFGKSTFIYFQF